MSEFPSVLKAELCYIVFIFHVFFACLSLCGPLGLSHLLALVNHDAENSVAVNTGVQIVPQDSAFSHCGYIF